MKEIRSRLINNITTSSDLHEMRQMLSREDGQHVLMVRAPLTVTNQYPPQFRIGTLDKHLRTNYDKPSLGFWQR